MKTENILAIPTTQPELLNQTQELLTKMRELSLADLQKIWRCSDKLARENFEQLQELELTRPGTAAITAFSGLQYQSLAADLLARTELDYLGQHLRILSGFYGVLRPFDGILPYRLEMQSKLPINDANNLYHFWGPQLYQSLNLDSEDFVINLASKEYAKAITPYLQPGQELVNLFFADLIDHKPKVKATKAKIARGQMVRYLAKNHISTIADIKNFDHPNYDFAPTYSHDNDLVFIAKN